MQDNQNSIPGTVSKNLYMACSRLNFQSISLNRDWLKPFTQLLIALTDFSSFKMKLERERELIWNNLKQQNWISIFSTLLCDKIDVLIKLVNFWCQVKTPHTKTLHTKTPHMPKRPICQNDRYFETLVDELVLYISCVKFIMWTLNCSSYFHWFFAIVINNYSWKYIQQNLKWTALTCWTWNTVPRWPGDPF